MKEVSFAGGLAQAVRAGAYWIRFGAFNWDEIQPLQTDPPQYNWAAVDELSLKNIAATGTQAIAIVRFAPPWAQKVPGAACGPIKEDALDDFAAFLSAAVKKYSKPPYNVLYWELGNEPDVHPSAIPPGAGWGCWGDKNATTMGAGTMPRC
jgi:hypothetical protein